MLNLFLLITSTLWSQAVKKFELGINLQPKVSSSHLPDYYSSIELKTPWAYGFSSGIDVGFWFNENWSIRTGLHFHLENFSYEVNGIFFNTSQDTNNQGMKATNVHDEVRLMSVSIPIRVVYELANNWRIIGGININENLSYNRERQVENPAGEEDLFNEAGLSIYPGIFSPMIGFGKSFRWNLFELELLPYLEYSFHTIDMIFISGSESQLNIGLGLSFRFS